MSIWDQISAGAELFGRKYNLPEMKVSEIFGRPTTPQNILESVVRPVQAAESSPTVLGQQSQNFIGPPYSGPQTPIGGQSGQTGGGGNTGDTLRRVVDETGQDYIKEVSGVAQNQQDAETLAAINAWNETRGALDTAKTNAKGLYDWSAETISKQKDPLLQTLTADEEMEKKQLAARKEEEAGYYGEQKQSTLQMYRDLSLKTEKMMRGSGMIDSSRSQEAQFKLDRLMTKDMGQWSDKEVKAVQTINDKVEYATKTYAAKRQKVEDDALARTDKARLDYEAEVREINNSYLINDNGKAEAIRAAANNAQAIVAQAKIDQANRRAELEQQLALMKADIDTYISNNLTEEISPTLSTTRQGTNSLSGVTFNTGVNIPSTPTGYRNYGLGRGLSSIEDPLYQAMYGQA